MIQLETNTVVDTDITRVEVITDKGRQYVNWKSNNVVQLSLQDYGKTLKVFIGTNNELPNPIDFFRYVENNYNKLDSALGGKYFVNKNEGIRTLTLEGVYQEFITKTT